MPEEILPKENTSPEPTDPTGPRTAPKPAGPPPGAPPEVVELGFKRNAIVFINLLCALFLVALDRTIIGTAIPAITDEFHSLSDIGWYQSGYLLTFSVFQLIYGKIYRCFPVKWVYMASVVLFEVGSAVCGAAPTSNAFIAGRALAGVGASGVFGGIIMVMLEIVPLHKRPLYVSFFGMVFAVSSILGPIVGGAFTTNVTWRWCFYINLPIGGAVLVLVYFLLPLNPAWQNAESAQDFIKRLDVLGFSAVTPCVICLLLVLQWGGTTYSWSNWRCIILWDFFGILLVASVAVQYIQGEEASFPKRIIAKRDFIVSFLGTFGIGAVMVIYLFYMPIWFQAVQNRSAVKSGIMTLPMVIGLVIASLTAGLTVRKFGYYAPFFVFGTFLLAIGCGLLTTLKYDSGHAKYLGYQALVGLGIGFSMQQPNMCVQNTVDRKDTPMAMAMMLFAQTLGGAVMLPVMQNLFLQKLVKALTSLSNLDTNAIINTGATDIRKLIPQDELTEVSIKYSEAITRSFYLPVGLSIAVSILSLLMRWRKVQKPPQKNPPGEKTDKENSLEIDIEKEAADN